MFSLLLNYTNNLGAYILPYADSSEQGCVFAPPVVSTQPLRLILSVFPHPRLPCVNQQTHPWHSTVTSFDCNYFKDSTFLSSTGIDFFDKIAMMQ